MKTILFLGHADAGQEARLQVALDLCRALDGHLACLDVYSPPGAYGELYGVTAVQFDLLDIELESEAANRQALEARLATEDVRWDWTHVIGSLERRIVETARMADLIVASSHLGGGLGESAIVTGLILRANRPVLAVPPDARGLNAAGKALVAWDGSTQAIESLRAAVPLLALASDVRILEVGDTTREYGANEAAVYLSRHGIGATVMHAELVDTQSHSIIERARLIDAAYVVMGGYGHSRIGELLFGGVTREMLAHCPVPMFIAH